MTSEQTIALSFSIGCAITAVLYLFLLVVGTPNTVLALTWVFCALYVFYMSYKSGQLNRGEILWVNVLAIFGPVTLAGFMVYHILKVRESKNVQNGRKS